MDSLNIVQKVKEALIAIGFSEEEAENQSNGLSEIVILSFYKKLSELEGSEDPVLLEKSKEKYSKEELSKILLETAVPTINSYFNEVSADLPEEKKKMFYEKLSSI